jgi:hypothetical protein
MRGYKITIGNGNPERVELLRLSSLLPLILHAKNRIINYYRYSNASNY